jgi:hypothetical protein
MGCVVLNGALGERRLAAHCELSNGNGSAWKWRPVDNVRQLCKRHADQPIHAGNYPEAFE